jgi:hypothetical protein
MVSDLLDNLFYLWGRSCLANSSMTFGVFDRRLRLITGMFFSGLWAGLPVQSFVATLFWAQSSLEGYTDHVWTFRELLTVKFKPLDSQSISR